MAKYLIRTAEADRFGPQIVNKHKITAKSETDAVIKVLMKIGWVEKGKDGIKDAKRWMRDWKEGKGEYYGEELTVEVTKI